MSGLLAWVAAKAGPLLVSYVGTKVVGRLTEHWWGRAATFVVKKIVTRKTGEDYDALRKELNELKELTADQRSKLNEREQSIVDHKSTPPNPA